MGDYHEYVFRDNELVGEFEEMYKESRDVPWHQDEQENWIDVRMTEEILSDIGPFDTIFDYGCGLGYYLDILKRRIGKTSCRACGFDISPTACSKARNRFPNAEFDVIDLMRDKYSNKEKYSGEDILRGKSLHVIRGTLWYVFPKIQNVVANIRSEMEEGEFLLVVQNFPPLTTDFIGKNVIPNHEALIQHFSPSFNPMRTLWYEDKMKSANDNWFIGLFCAG